MSSTSTTATSLKTPHQAIALQAALDKEALALSKNPDSIFHPSRGAGVPLDGASLRQSRKSIGLALSGGGIRSATFSLGVLQALASRGKLASFDYLSTVSGGGYIGSWLSAWIHRVGMAKVQEQLTSGANIAPTDSPVSAEPAELVWLRRYSNYLTPHVGILSMDTLTLLATWLRNVTLNLVILLAFFALLFTVPYALLLGFNAVLGHATEAGYAAAWVGLFFIAGIGYNLWRQGVHIRSNDAELISTRGVMLTVIMPGIAAALCAVVWWADRLVTGIGWAAAVPVLMYLALLLLVLLVAWVFAELFYGKAPWLTFKEAVIQAMAGGVALVVGLLLMAAASALLPGDKQDLPQYRLMMLCLGLPVFLIVLGLTTSVFTGMVGRAYFERSREWWSRLNAWLIVIGAGWAIWCSLTFFSLQLLEWVYSNIGGWISLIATSWVGSLLAALFFRRPESASIRKQERIEFYLNLASTVFVVGLVFLAAAATQKALFAFAADSETTHMGKIQWVLADNPQLANLPFFLVSILVLLGVTALFAWRVDINKFSLHNMYKNRLVRCYLGASHQSERNEQPFVGLDDNDDLPLHTLGGSDKDQIPPQVPLHIINATMNLTQGGHLAWQERKAASFVFTPLFCGYSLGRTQGDTTSLKSDDAAGPGYCSTDLYAAKDPEEKGFTLGMALATSGAAVSPNMGRASKPMLAFVLTLFNIRLGRWSPNPAQDQWASPSPRFGLLALLSELLGWSDERSSYVYLSDGGHFDNLGLYELVRRRCHVIMAVDATADDQREMSDLADAVRKCRVDLGVDIEFDGLNDFRGNDQRLCKAGYLIGRIHYDPTNIGTLVLIKPGMAQAHDESADVMNYAIQNPTFPHQTTVDQFFDESQFESFRRLGKKLGDQFLDDRTNSALLPDRTPAPFVPPPRGAITQRNFLKRVLDHLSAPPPQSPTTSGI